MPVPKKTIKYDVEKMAGIESMWDFYQRIGLLDDFESGEITHVSQIYIDGENCERLQELIKATLKKSRKFKGWKDNRVDAVASMDWANYSPVSGGDIPKDEVWVFNEQYALRERVERNGENNI